jgi:hypothetical protein
MELKDAYSLKELGAELKAEGLEVAEDTAETVYKAMKAWLKKSAAKSSTPVDDLVFQFLDQIDQLALPLIDKINPGDNSVQ